MFVVTVVTFSFVVLCLFQLLLTKTVRHSTKSTNTLCSDLTIVLQIKKKQNIFHEQNIFMFNDTDGSGHQVNVGVVCKEFCADFAGLLLCCVQGRFHFVAVPR